MGLIEVDAANLRVVANHLTDASAIAKVVKDHGSQLSDHASQAGHPLVVDALSTFIGKWGYGCGCLTSDSDQTSDRLHRASKAYIDNDHTVSRDGFHGK